MHSCSKRRGLDPLPWIPTIQRVRIAGRERYEHLDTFVASARSVRRALVAVDGRLSWQYDRPGPGEGRTDRTADRRSRQGRGTATQRDVVVARRVDSLPDRRAVRASDGLRENDRCG